jgi:hypothetical protein
MTAIRGQFGRPVNFALQVALVFLIGCATAPKADSPPAWVVDKGAEKEGRLYVVARGGPTGVPSHARRVALLRGAKDIARSLGEVRVVARSYDRQTAEGDRARTDQSAVAEESETLIKAVLQDLRVEAEWVDLKGVYSGMDGRVYYLLLSIAKER